MALLFMESVAQLKVVFLLLAALMGSSCEPASPAVKQIYPYFGLMRGGERLEIRGENLQQLDPLTVYLGERRVQTSGFDGKGTLWVLTPAANEESFVDVRVIGSDGTEFVIPDGFQYVRSAKMAECVNVGRRLNGHEVVPRRSMRSDEGERRTIPE